MIAPSPVPSRPVVAVGAASCAAFGLCAWAVFVLSFHHDGLIALRYNAPGADFIVYYLASQAVLYGNNAVLFDGARFTAVLNAECEHWLTAPLPLYPWIYPPQYLLLLAPLALIPFAACSWPALSRSPRWRCSRGACGSARSSPRCSRWRRRRRTTVGGQNAFLTAALLVGGIRLAGARPVLGGAILGVLSVKPQLCLMVPVALAAAALSVLALVALSVLAFGLMPWALWVQNVLDPGSDFMRSWSELSLRWGDSVESAALAPGASRDLAAAAQAVAILVGGACVFAAYRRDDSLKLPVLLAATIAAAPHVGAYDAILLALAAALYLLRALETGARPFDLALVLVLWLAPLYGSPAQVEDPRRR